MYIQSLVLFIFGLVVISVDSFHTITSRRISVARAIKFTMSDENKEIIGKKKLVELLFDKTSSTVALSKVKLETIVDGLLEVISDEVLQNGKEVRLRDFGTFKTKVTKARTGRNPKTGEDIQIQGGISVSFRAASSLKKKDS